MLIRRYLCSILLMRNLHSINLLRVSLDRLNHFLIAVIQFVIDAPHELLHNVDVLHHTSKLILNAQLLGLNVLS